ncbi:MAG: SBBP repeat-containing protein [Flavobacteriales bacterium]
MKTKYILALLILLYQTDLFSQSTSLDWAYAIGGTADDQVTSMAKDNFGHIFTTGLYYGTLDFDPNAGSSNLTSSSSAYGIFIQKIDYSSNLIWAKSIGDNSTSYNTLTSNSITTDNSGNIYITGEFEGTVDFNPNAGINTLSSVSSSIEDVFILKLDSSGNFLWVKSIGGSIYNTNSRTITTDVNGDMYIAGEFGGSVDFDPNAGTYTLSNGGHFALKLDANGNFIWAKEVQANWYVTSIKTDDDSNVYLCGSFDGIVDFDPGINTYNLTATISGNDIYLLKLNTQGDFIWAKNFGSDGSENESLDMEIDLNGDVYITGFFNDTLDFDPGPGVFELYSKPSTSSDNIFITKLDSSGNFSWAATADGNGQSYGYSISSDFVGNVYVTGYCSGTFDFDPSPNSYNLTTINGADIFILSLNTSGNFRWANIIGGSDPILNRGKSILTDTIGNVYVGGHFEETVDFDPGTGVLNYTSNVNNTTDLFVLKLNQTPAVGINTHKNYIEDFLIYPNPTLGQLNITSKNGTIQQIIITDITGKTLKTATSNFNSIAVNELKTGTYIIKIKSEKGLSVQKFIKH